MLARTKEVMGCAGCSFISTSCIGPHVLPGVTVSYANTCDIGVVNGDASVNMAGQESFCGPELIPQYQPTYLGIGTVDMELG